MRNERKKKDDTARVSALHAEAQRLGGTLRCVAGRAEFESAQLSAFAQVVHDAPSPEFSANAN